MAHQYCIACHIFPNPELLDKRSWNYVLTHMSMRMGIIDKSPIANASELEKNALEDRFLLLEKLNLIPDQPIITLKDWLKLRSYYLSNAPDSPISQKPKPECKEGNDWFEIKKHHFNVKPAINTMVAIDETKQELLIGNMGTSKLSILDKDLDAISDTLIAPGTGVLSIRESDDGIYLLAMGDLAGSYPDQRRGVIFHAKRFPFSYEPDRPVLQGLYRPCSMDFGDLNGDAINEIVICNFGIEKGSIAIYEPDTESKNFRSEPRRVLLTDSGAVACQLHDFNGDGLMDIAALISNEKENFNIFINRGNYEFERQILIQQHPAFGYVGFRLIDFNKDGLIDIVTVNGDNGDNDPYNTLKNYHGVRIYLGKGNLEFREAYFYPMYGAYGIEIEDFDLDGDYDIAINAFHPDFNAPKREQFVVLKQFGNLEFQPWTHPSTRQGRWITMDSGDLDGDGDKDIVLAAGYIATGLMYDNEKLMYEMAKNHPSLLFLENKTIP